MSSKTSNPKKPSASEVSYPTAGSTSVASGYRLGNDSDEEDHEPETAVVPPTAAGVQDVEELRAQTRPLLDTTWKEQRDSRLLMKLLELDEPTITAKMVDFLLLGGVCELLLSFITQLDKGPRPSPQSHDNEGLKLSYKATILITPDEPSDALHNFLSRKADVITKNAFHVFQDNSAGSFYHAARILETLIRMFPAETYAAMTDDGLLSERMDSLLRHVGCVPVSDIIVMIVCMSPVPKASHLYALAAKSRWRFIQGLSSMVFMLKLAEVASDPKRFCWTDGHVSAEEHINAALQVLQELVEKFSLEDTGEILLQPFGYCLELLDLLVNCGLGILSTTREGDSLTGLGDDAMPRRVYLRCLCYLLKRSANSEIVVYVGNPGGPPAAVKVTNMLYPLRSKMLDHLKSRVPSFCAVLLKMAADEEAENAVDATDSMSSPKCSVSYPGHKVSRSFSSYRILVIECLVLMMEAMKEVAPQLPLDLWKALISWVFRYPHNNIYHSMFYRILFAVLRQNDETVLKNILQKSRLIAELFDHYEPYSTTGHAAGPGKGASVDAINKNSLRGIVTNCANAIRLQMESLPPSSYLHIYLTSHTKWIKFVPVMRTAAIIQQQVGLGFFVPTDTKVPGGTTSLQHLAALFAAKDDLDIDGIDHGSKYAKSLGFDGESSWPADLVVETATKKKRKNKKKKKNHRKRNGLSVGSNEDSEDRVDDDGDEDDDSEDDESSGERASRDSTGSGDPTDNLAASLETVAIDFVDEKDSK